MAEPYRVLLCDFTVAQQHGVSRAIETFYVEADSEEAAIARARQKFYDETDGVTPDDDRSLEAIEAMTQEDLDNETVLMSAKFNGTDKPGGVTP